MKSFALPISVWMTNGVVPFGSRNIAKQTHKTRSVLFFILLPTALIVVSQEDLKTSHNRHNIHANLQERGRDHRASGLEGRECGGTGAAAVWRDARRELDVFLYVL